MFKNKSNASCGECDVLVDAAMLENCDKKIFLFYQRISNDSRKIDKDFDVKENSSQASLSRQLSRNHWPSIVLEKDNKTRNSCFKLDKNWENSRISQKKRFKTLKFSASHKIVNFSYKIAL